MYLSAAVEERRGTRLLFIYNHVLGARRRSRRDAAVDKTTLNSYPRQQCHNGRSRRAAAEEGVSLLLRRRSTQGTESCVLWSSTVAPCVLRWTQ